MVLAIVSTVQATLNTSMVMMTMMTKDDDAVGAV